MEEIQGRRSLETRTELLGEGAFEGGVFRRSSATGKRNQDAYEAVWERANGRKLVYPAPRYDMPIIVDPDGFDWKATGARGVMRKKLGSFTERETSLDMIRVEAGSSWNSPPAKAVRLMFVVDGKGKCGGKSFTRHTVVETTGSERAEFRAAADSGILCLTMPHAKAANERAA